MLLAVLVTFLYPGMTNYPLIIAAIVVGIVGIVLGFLREPTVIRTPCDCGSASAAPH
mgnify:CR=1 FL=1